MTAKNFVTNKKRRLIVDLTYEAKDSKLAERVHNEGKEKLSKAAKTRPQRRTSRKRKTICRLEDETELHEAMKLSFREFRAKKDKDRKAKKSSENSQVEIQRCRKQNDDKKVASTTGTTTTITKANKKKRKLRARARARADMIMTGKGERRYFVEERPGELVKFKTEKYDEEQATSSETPSVETSDDKAQCKNKESTNSKIDAYEAKQEEEQQITSTESMIDDKTKRKKADQNIEGKLDSEAEGMIDKIKRKEADQSIEGKLDSEESIEFTEESDYSGEECIGEEDESRFGKRTLEERICKGCFRMFSNRVSMKMHKEFCKGMRDDIEIVLKARKSAENQQKKRPKHSKRENHEAETINSTLEYTMTVVDLEPIYAYAESPIISSRCK